MGGSFQTTTISREAGSFREPVDVRSDPAQPAPRMWNDAACRWNMAYSDKLRDLADALDKATSDSAALMVSWLDVIEMLLRHRGRDEPIAAVPSETCLRLHANDQPPHPSQSNRSFYRLPPTGCVSAAARPPNRA